MNSKKIIIITPYYYPIIGGITTYVDNLYKKLLEKGNQVKIIASKGKNKDHVNIFGSKKYIFILKSYFYLRREKPNVLHSHSHWHILAPCVLYKIFHPKTVLIHTFHTDPPNKIVGLKKKNFEWLLSFCDSITFVSKYMKNKISNDYKLKSKKKVIYAGVGRKGASEEDVKKFIDKYNLKDCKPIISFIGPLTWELKVEGVKTLIKAFDTVRKEYPKAKLLIVGDGDYKKDLEKFSKMRNIQEDVIFTGFMDSSSTPLALTEIYTHISLQEGGVSISVLEAMSLEKPVVATKTGGIPELVEHGVNGVLVKPEPGEIAKEILGLYRDSNKIKELVKNAKRTISERHNWDSITEEFIRLYEGEGA